jgi:hypothetical protein
MSGFLVCAAWTGILRAGAQASGNRQRPLTIAWAREHHSLEAAWIVPVAVGRALRAADQE